MDVEELFQRLSCGELVNLSMAGEGNGAIAAGSQAQIITHANEGLLRLYSRFILSKKEVIVEMMTDIHNYYLLRRFAESNCVGICEDPTYIKDATNPFPEDVIKVLQVFDPDGCRLPLNEPDNWCSVTTPQFNLLNVPNIDPGRQLKIIYQARHVPLEQGVLGAFIYLPGSLEGALTAYIAHRVYRGMNGQDNAAKSQEYLDAYNTICNEVTAMDLVAAETAQVLPKFEDRGFA